MQGVPFPSTGRCRFGALGSDIGECVNLFARLMSKEFVHPVNVLELPWALSTKVRVSLIWDTSVRAPASASAWCTSVLPERAAIIRGVRPLLSKASIFTLATSRHSTNWRLCQRKLLPLATMCNAVPPSWVRASRQARRILPTRPNAICMASSNQTQLAMA